MQNIFEYRVYVNVEAYQHDSKRITNIILSWLSKCNVIRKLDFSPQLLTEQNIKNAKNHRYLPISYSKLSFENKELFNIISKKWKQ
jgi:hypothetical protein